MTERETRIGGKPVKVYSGLARALAHLDVARDGPPDDGGGRAVLVWEGLEGSFYVLDERWNVVKEIPVLPQVGDRYAFIFALADPGYPPDGRNVRLGDSGKLMALAAFADAADAHTRRGGDRGPDAQPRCPAPRKGRFRDLPIYNAGVEAPVTKQAAALITKRIFDIFADGRRPRDPGRPAAVHLRRLRAQLRLEQRLARAGPLLVGVRAAVRERLGLGARHRDRRAVAATGTRASTGAFTAGSSSSTTPSPTQPAGRAARSTTRHSPMRSPAGRVAWVQGRWEMGPRALGNRSILAEPFSTATRDRLNEIKGREDYRPIAPVCRLEEAGSLFDRDFPDPYMLYFRRVANDTLGAVTHVDGSARAQTVTSDSNRPLHDLLSAFSGRHGAGVLCNTSLNFRGLGFINRMTDLEAYCVARGLDGMVVGSDWWARRAP